MEFAHQVSSSMGAAATGQAPQVTVQMSLSTVLTGPSGTATPPTVPSKPQPKLAAMAAQSA